MTRLMDESRLDEYPEPDYTCPMDAVCMPFPSNLRMAGPVCFSKLVDAGIPILRIMKS